MTVYAPELTEIATRLKAYAFLSFFFSFPFCLIFAPFAFAFKLFFFCRGSAMLYADSTYVQPNCSWLAHICFSFMLQGTRTKRVLNCCSASRRL